MASTSENLSSVLNEILTSVKALSLDHSQLVSRVDEINGKVNVLASLKEVRENAEKGTV
jgi:hypothetical protein